MNKLTLFTFCVLTVCSGRSFSQTRIERDQTFSYDLINPNNNFPGDFVIKRNVRFRYQIDNINRNVYNITLNSVSRSNFSTVPDVFNVITAVDMSKVTSSPGDAAGAANSSLATLQANSTDEEKDRIKDFLNARSALITAIDNFDKKNKVLKALILLHQSFGASMEDGINTFNFILQAKQSATCQVLKNHFGYTGANNDEAALSAALQAASVSIFQELETAYKEVTDKYEPYKLQFLVLEKAVAAKLAALNKTKLTGKNKTAISDHQLKIADIESEFDLQKFKAEGFAELVSDIKSIHSKIVETEQGGFSTKLINAYKKITIANWQYISPSIKGEKDELTVTLDIQPKEATGIITPNYAQFNGEYSGDVYGFKVNFSTGLFALIGKDLFDRSYRVDTVTDDPESSIIVQNDRRKWIQPAVGGLMHFYNKRPGFFSWGGTIGFSISNETRLNYHGGLSFLFGHEQRVIANVGVTLTAVKMIESAYYVGQKLKRSSGITTVNTEDVYRAGAFFALTYNLTR